MANSVAQTIAICELCDNSNPVRWNCINCLENLCDSCKIVHTTKQKIKRREYMLNSYTYITVYNHFVLTDDQCKLQCVNCLENLCDSCKIVHERGKLTKHHEVVSQRDYSRLQGTKRLESQCEFHNDFLNLGSALLFHRKFVTVAILLRRKSDQSCRGSS
jgi:hypothetical protein